MTVSLTAYLNTAASTTLTTANKLSDTLGSGTVGTRNSTVGTATGYSEVYAQGTSNAWAAAGSIGSPSGNGFLYDSPNLENCQFAAGNWTPSIRLTSSGTTFTADVYLRLYRRTSGGVYTLLNSFSKSAQSITSSGITINFTAANLSAITFNIGDKLYCDVWANVTGAGSGNMKLNESSTANTGITTAQIITPGYISLGNATVRDMHRSVGRVQ